VAIELLLGAKYAWAMFDRILQGEYGFAATQTQLVFSMTVALFAVGLLLSGRLQDRFGPRVTTAAGAVLYGGGLVVAGLGGPRFATLFIGAGVMLGLGVAFAYIGPMATAVKWFPRRKGVATGVVIAGYGGGAFFVGSAAQLMLRGGMDVFGVFTAMGLICGGGILFLALMLKVPAEYVNNGRLKLGLPRGLLKGRHFRALAAGLFAGTFAGLAVIGSLEQIGASQGAPEWALVFAVQLLAVGNAVGRVGWGVLMELVGATRAIIASLISQAACVAALAAFGGSGAAFVVLVFMVGFNYGGCFVLYLAEIAHIYGPERVGTVYGPVYLVYSLSGFLAPFITGRSFDLTGSYLPALAAAVLLAAAGAAAFIVLYLHPDEREARPGR